MSPCLKPNRERDRFERALNDLTRRRTHRDDPDLVQFAAHLRTASTQSLAATTKSDIWQHVLSSSTPLKAACYEPTTPVPGGLRGTTTRRWRLPAPVIPRSLPAPAVLLFGVLIALVVALSGFGHDGHEMVTPTAYAQQAATAIASPANPLPTATWTINEGT